jgi:dienelactone hydrolase
MRAPLALLLLLAACAEAPPAPPPATSTTAAPAAAAPGAPRPGPLAPPQGRWREQTHLLPVGNRLIQMRLCRPEGDAPAPLVLINHGSPTQAFERRGMAAPRCESEPVQWFLARGFAVGAPLRRGYGNLGGDWVESAGPCNAVDYAQAGLRSAQDIGAALAYARGLPAVDASKPAVVLGQSAGGWGTLALASQNPPGVGAYINMAGGRGGWQNGPNTNCRPDLLARDAGRFGATARTPSLWIYTENDSFFRPAIAAEMHEAFVAAGAPATLHQLPPYRQDGHGLFFGQNGSATWGPLVEAFLQAQGMLP